MFITCSGVFSASMYWSVLGPIMITWLLLFVSGTNLLVFFFFGVGVRRGFLNCFLSDMVRGGEEGRVLVGYLLPALEKAYSYVALLLQY